MTRQNRGWEVYKGCLAMDVIEHGFWAFRSGLLAGVDGWLHRIAKWMGWDGLGLGLSLRGWDFYSLLWFLCDWYPNTVICSASKWFILPMSKMNKAK